MSAAAATSKPNLLALEPRRSSNRTGVLPFLRRLLSRRPAQIGAFIIVLLVLMAVFAPLIATHDPEQIKVGKPFTGPNSD
ncbi:MAG: ABC transporter permease, partial [Thermomicrobiales bacterium]|nr:ABC transporter permease [Thermomicrobiales bacterium]